VIESISPNAAKARHGALQEVTINSNIMTANHMPKYEAKKPFATLEDDVAESLPAKTRENAFGLASQPRPRVGSSARRSALGWSKRSSGKASSELKENVGVVVSMT
jgi:serine/arginine repetitive matrix protein 2